MVEGFVVDFRGILIKLFNFYSFLDLLRSNIFVNGLGRNNDTVSIDYRYWNNSYSRSLYSSAMNNLFELKVDW